MYKWYCKSFAVMFGTIEKDVTNFLNELNDNGIDPNEIKITSPTASCMDVFYYSNKEIK